MRGSVNVPGPGVAKMATGSYTGSGGDQTLTFDFSPKMVVISAVLEATSIAASFVKSVVIKGQVYEVVQVGEEDPEVVFLTWQGKSLTLYKGDHGEHALGREDKTYKFFAIGE